MAKPIQYIPQFVPTDFSTVGNVLGMIRQDMQQRNQEFDQAVLMKEKALAELYGAQTYDNDFLKSNVDALAAKIEDAVKRRGMDYGAASKEIASLIAKEQANPAYKLNARKVEQVKALEEVLARNPNLAVLTDPRKMKLTADMNPEDIKYGVVDPQQYQENLKRMYAEWGDKRTPLGLVNRNGYDFFQTRVGMSPQEINNMTNNQDEFMKSLSGLGSYDEIVKNPELLNRFKGDFSNYLKGLDKGIVETMGMTPAHKASGSEGSGLASTKRGIPGPNIQREIKSEIPSASKLKQNLDLESTDEYTRNKSQQILDHVMTPEFVQSLGLTEKDKKGIEEAGNIYKYIDKSGGGDPEITGWGYKGITSWGRKATTPSEHKRLNKIKDLVDNQVDLYIKEQSYDFVTPVLQIDPYDTKSKSALAYISKEGSSLKDYDVIGEKWSTMDELDLKKNPDYQSLQKNGFTIIGATFESNDGVMAYIKDNDSGKSYLVKPKSPALTAQIAGVIDSDLSELDAYHNLSFAGDVAKGNVEGATRTFTLPFKVDAVTETDSDGRKRTMFHVKDKSGKPLTMGDYYVNTLAPMYQELLSSGYSEEEVQTIISTYYPEINDETKMNVPFKTNIKRNVMKFADALTPKE